MEFSLEEALNSVAGSSRRNEIQTFMSPIREAHTNDEDTSEVTLAFQSASEGCQYDTSTTSVSMKALKQGTYSLTITTQKHDRRRRVGCIEALLAFQPQLDLLLLWLLTRWFRIRGECRRGVALRVP